ncbi:MAG: choice-of-anchor B domain-containing protein [Paraglaciecola sp.]|jgi:choice-of-anchor B domain-containing protein
MKNILAFLFVCLPFFGFSQIEANLLGTWSDDSITPTSWLDGRYNDVWGTVVNGLEIAIVGSTAGVHFIDVTDPTNPTELAFVAGQADGDQLVHRDYHSYNGFLYTVADEGPSSLQIIDMNNLPASVEVIYDSNDLLVQSHNVFIDTTNQILYACNGNGFELKLIDISDPTNPVSLASYNSASLPISQIHDMYVRDGIAYLNCAGQGLYVMDFTVPTMPILLGSMTDYPQSGYNHSGWLSDDGEHYYLCDETHGMDVKTVSVADLSDISVTALFNAESTNNQIAHNAIVTGDLLYVSYYYDGLQVFDVSDPDNPTRVAYFDSFDGVSDGSYQGAWGVYPLLPSGNILLSDMNNGLFVIESMESLVDLSLSTSVNEITTCLGDEFSFEITIGNDFNENGADLSIIGLPFGATVSYSSNPAIPGEVVTVTVLNVQTAGDFDFEIIASDVDNSNEATIALAVGAVPNATNLNMPMDAATEVSLTPDFAWDATDNTDFYTIFVSADIDDFVGSVFINEETTNPTYNLTAALDPGIYYWMVTANSDCGLNDSDIFTFTTEGFNSVNHLEIEGLKIFPNPVADLLFIEINDLNATFQAEILNTQGQIFIEKSLQNTQSIDVADFPKGIYYLKISNEEGVVTKKIVVE